MALWGFEWTRNTPTPKMKIWSGLGTLSVEWPRIPQPPTKIKIWSGLVTLSVEWPRIPPPPPWKWKFGQDLAHWVLSGQEYPPHPNPHQVCGDLPLYAPRIPSRFLCIDLFTCNLLIVQTHCQWILLHFLQWDQSLLPQIWPCLNLLAQWLTRPSILQSLKANRYQWKNVTLLRELCFLFDWKLEESELRFYLSHCANRRYSFRTCWKCMYDYSKIRDADRIFWP